MFLPRKDFKIREQAAYSDMHFSVLNLLFRFSFFTHTHCKESYLETTALVNDAQNNAKFECWRFSKGFEEYPTIGKAVELGDVSNVTYVVLPPRSSEGWHNPPHLM